MKMGRACKIKTEIMSLALASDVYFICRPFFNEHKLNAFSYSRVFIDGSRSELWSDANALDHTFLNKKYLNNIYTPDNYQKSNRYIFLPSKIECFTEPFCKKNYINQILDQRNIFNHDNCFIIVNKSSKICEYFIFYTPLGIRDPVNFYFSKIENLEKFSLYFKEKARELINLADTEKIVAPFNINNSLTKKKNLAILGETCHGKRKRQAIKLTIREAQVAQHVINGKTARESAVLLGLSQRTIESYITNIKNKLVCDRKSELILKLINQNNLVNN